MVPLFNPSGLVINNFITELWIPLGAYVRADGHQLQIFLSQVCILGFRKHIGSRVRGTLVKYEV